MKKISVSLFFICCFAKNPVPKFEMETIDNEVGIGYRVQLADECDNMPDILLVDQDKVVVYEPHMEETHTCGPSHKETMLDCTGFEWGRASGNCIRRRVESK